MVMFSVEELGLIAYLNDNASSAMNSSILELTSDATDRVMDLYLSRGSDGEGTDESRVLKMLNDRGIRRDALARTTGRVRDYLENGVEVVTYWDVRYPRNLRLAYDPPLVLYVKGKAFPGSDQVAILGTSNPSNKGLDLAFEYGAMMAKKGHTVVSGLTRGVDAQAIEGALSTDGAPIAALGTPLTDIYPEESRALGDEVSRNGSVISELTEEAPIHPGRFLQRNKVISGMSASLVIIESTGVGAMLRVVELMVRLGRGAYVVDHGRFEDQDHEAGFHKLVIMGATPVTHADDIIMSEARQDKLF
jgi:DNA protecting protein DprA